MTSLFYGEEDGGREGWEQNIDVIFFPDFLNLFFSIFC